MKIKEYITISTYDLENLDVVVNKRIQEGWQPFGAPQYNNDVFEEDNPDIREEQGFFQAMVKYEDD